MWLSLPNLKVYCMLFLFSEQGSPICSEDEDEDDILPHRPKPATMYSGVYLNFNQPNDKDKFASSSDDLSVFTCIVE